MRMTITFLSFILITPAVWSQEVCQNYDYQELKDMSAEDLTREYCKVKEKNAPNVQRVLGNKILLDSYISVHGPTDPPPSSIRYIQAKEGCDHQQQRILRVLEQKQDKNLVSSPPDCQ